MSPRLRHAAHLLDRHQVPETATAILCVGLALLGADLIAFPDPYLDRPTFHVATTWAAPQLWGGLLLLPALATLAALTMRRRDIFWPLTGLVVWLTAWSAAAHLSTVIDGNVVRSASITYTTLACLAALLAAVYMREGRRQP
ncbi:hypothetical protein [Janibacter sp. LM]|uniref:hypothetical protein n=1 Tax=Janibacter sp. LM TaxID=3144845 RepID=UPI0031F66490